MPKPNKGESKQDYLKRCTGELVKKEGKNQDQAYAMCNRRWDDSHSQRAALSLAVPLEMEQPENPEEPAGFLITAYTGQVIDRGWWGKLVIDTAGIKTKAKLPILREHQRDRVVGMGNKSWKDGSNFFIRGNYSNITPDGREVRDLMGEGFPWQASIGVWPKKIKVLDSDKETIKVNGQDLAGPLEIWQESEVREVSFVALGADDETAAINFAEGERVRVQIDRGQPQKDKEEQDMPMTLAQLEAEAPELLKEIQEKARAEIRAEMLAKDPDCKEIEAEATARERLRVKEILEAGGDLEITLQAIKDGTSVPETVKLLLKASQEGKARSLAKLREEMPGSIGQIAPPENQGDFMGKVEEMLAKGEAKNRGEAVRLAARRFPKLHEEYKQAQHQKAQK